MQNAVSELGIKNSRVLHTRIENESMERQYDTVISRAFATVNDMLCKAGRLCKPDGQILAMKGAEPTQELANLIPGFKLEKCINLHVPGLDAQRHLVQIVSANIQ